MMVEQEAANAYVEHDEMAAISMSPELYKWPRINDSPNERNNPAGSDWPRRPYLGWLE